MEKRSSVFFVSEIRLRDHVDVGAIIDKAKGRKERLSKPKRTREREREWQIRKRERERERERQQLQQAHVIPASSSLYLSLSLFVNSFPLSFFFRFGLSLSTFRSLPPLPFFFLFLLTNLWFWENYDDGTWILFCWQTSQLLDFCLDLICPPPVSSPPSRYRYR